MNKRSSFIIATIMPAQSELALVRLESAAFSGSPRWARDVNHGFASKLGGKPVDHALAAPYPPHADEIRSNA